tara:strand:+ start:412 stop:978 length:567 start_codon:yes stop_codon:yes gene_type:complete
MIIDLFLVYQFIRRLATPFNEWSAFKLGIIDETGKQLIKRKNFTTKEQKDSFQIFDIMIAKLKRLLEKVPGGKSRIGSYAAALYLIKENNQIEQDCNTLTEEQLTEKLEEYMNLVESTIDIDKIFENAFDEDAPANSAGSGNIAGIGVGPDGEPGVSKSQQKKKKNKQPLKRFRDATIEIDSTPNQTK